MNINEKNGSLNISPESGQEICDFCSSEEVHWSIDCEDIVLPSGVASRGDWAACTPCKELVAQKQWVALEKRSVETFMQGNAELGIPKHIVEQFVHDLHTQFRRLHGEINPFYKNVA